jgi:AcrR family transcriptional regulator
LKTTIEQTFMPARRQSPRKRRKQGRPQKDMPAIGRATLISATRQLMKMTPPAQITRLAIARAAGVDPALIRYYFGDRSALLVAAALQAGAELHDRQLSTSAQAVSVTDKIRRRIAVLLETLYEDPSLHHLIIERIIHSKSKQARQLRQDMVYGTCKELASIIEQGVASGELRRVDPRHLFLAMIGACSFPMAERALFAELMGAEPTRKQLDAYTEFVADLFLNGLAGGARKRKREPEQLLEGADS